MQLFVIAFSLCSSFYFRCGSMFEVGFSAMRSMALMGIRARIAESERGVFGVFYPQIGRQNEKANPPSTPSDWLKNANANLEAVMAGPDWLEGRGRVSMLESRRCKISPQCNKHRCAHDLGLVGVFLSRMHHAEGAANCDTDGGGT